MNSVVPAPSPTLRQQPPPPRQQYLELKASVTHILDQINQWRGAVPPCDDVTLLAMEFDPGE